MPRHRARCCAARPARVDPVHEPGHDLQVVAGERLPHVGQLHIGGVIATRAVAIRRFRSSLAAQSLRKTGQSPFER